MNKPILSFLLSLFMMFNANSFARAKSVKEEALRLYNSQKYRDSLPFFKSLIKDSPQDFHLRAKYAYVLYKLKIYLQAKQEFELILAKSKNKNLEIYAKKILQLIAIKYTPKPVETPDTKVIDASEIESLNTRSSAPPLPIPSSPELKGVYDLVSVVQNQDKLSDIVPYLTQDSATLLSFNLIFALQLMSRFKVIIPDESKRQRFHLLDTEIKHLLQRYNVTNLTQKYYLEPFEKIRPMGRVFLKDLALLLQTYEDPSGNTKDKVKLLKHLQLEQLDFVLLDDTHIQIKHKKNKSIWEAHQIKGLWKLHVGGVDKISPSLD